VLELRDIICIRIIMAKTSLDLNWGLNLILLVPWAAIANPSLPAFKLPENQWCRESILSDPR
jgi:hypothetical protein